MKTAFGCNDITFYKMHIIRNMDSKIDRSEALQTNINKYMLFYYVKEKIIQS